MTGKPIAIFGAGFIGRKLLGQCRMHDIPVACFLDNHHPELEVEGIPVMRPATALTPDLRAASTVVLAVRNPGFDPAQSRDQLALAGWGEVLSCAAFNVRHLETFGDLFWGKTKAFYDEHEKSIAQARGLWSDAKSVAVYDALVTFRRTLDDSHLGRPDADSYFPSDVPSWDEPIRFVDGGGFIGDTLQDLHKRGLKVDAGVVFEPDPRNFARMQMGLEALSFPVQAWPCGLHSSARQLRFSAVGGLNSTLQDDGEAVIQCVSLDEALHGFCPTLIKLDVEGAELAALQGACRILREDHPGWAVCVYHRAEDLWQLPLWFAEQAARPYRYYLRAHAFEGEDTVMYVVP
jgi:FkbM family methyltransferase